MGHSQIAAFARLANGQVTPTRNIFGQNTLITRSIHKFAYDPVKDEIVVPQFQAQAILFFRAGANGDEAPVRVIKGLWSDGPFTFAGRHYTITALDGVPKPIQCQGGRSSPSPSSGAG